MDSAAEEPLCVSVPLLLPGRLQFPCKARQLVLRESSRCLPVRLPCAVLELPGETRLQQPSWLQGLRQRVCFLTLPPTACPAGAAPAAASGVEQSRGGSSPPGGFRGTLNGAVTSRLCPRGLAGKACCCLERKMHNSRRGGGGECLVQLSPSAILAVPTCCCSARRQKSVGWWFPVAQVIKQHQG